MKCKILLMACLSANLLFSGVTSAHSSDEAKFISVNDTGYLESCSSSFNSVDSVINCSRDNPFRDYERSNRRRYESRDDNPFRDYARTHPGRHHNRDYDDDYYTPQF